MAESTSPHLERGLNLLHATSLNVANMLGAGPFITIPVLLGTMMGPQAMIGWAVALVIVMCDGLIWAELGAAFPGTGGTYHFLREIFQGSAWGRFLPFLFIWQFLISGTLEVASGYIAASEFTMSLCPSFHERLAQWGVPDRIVTGTVAALMAAVMFRLALPAHPVARLAGHDACRRRAGSRWHDHRVGLSQLRSSSLGVSAGRISTSTKVSLWVWEPQQVWPSMTTWATTTSAILGEEVREPQKTIPRAVILSIIVVVLLYVSMNLAIIGVVPWQETLKEGTLANKNIAGAFMTKLYGDRVAAIFTVFIIWTCLAGLFAMTLGYSRIVYAAAKNGDFFSFFDKLHPTKGYPWAALMLLTALTAFFCFFPLKIVIEGAVVVRIIVQFIGQIFALHVVRREKKHPLPFRMWLYPLPSLLALVGWVLLLASTAGYLLSLIVIIYGSGLLVFILRDQLSESANR